MSICPIVQVYILTRDRPDFLKEALDSVLMQDLNNCEVIVSDNSEQDDTELLLNSEYPAVRYIRRYPAVSAYEHFRLIIQEASKELLVMFHDDDVMSSEYIRTMRQALINNPYIGAVGCNAYIMNGEEKTTRSVMGTAYSRVVTNAEDLLKSYMSIDYTPPCPFPGYMYSVNYIKDICLNAEDGGRYSDVSFLIKLINKRPIMWLGECLFYYRIHMSNDTKNESIGHRLKLLRYIYRNTKISRTHKYVNDYRFKYWLSWLRVKKVKLGKVKKYNIRLFLIKHFLKRSLSDIHFVRFFLARVAEKLFH